MVLPCWAGSASVQQAKCGERSLGYPVSCRTFEEIMTDHEAKLCPGDNPCDLLQGAGGFTVSDICGGGVGVQMDAEQWSQDCLVGENG
jgi:hypothetical protein